MLAAHVRLQCRLTSDRLTRTCKLRSSLKRYRNRRLTANISPAGQLDIRKLSRDHNSSRHRKPQTEGSKCVSLGSGSVWQDCSAGVPTRAVRDRAKGTETNRGCGHPRYRRQPEPLPAAEPPRTNSRCIQDFRVHYRWPARPGCEIAAMESPSAAMAPNPSLPRSGCGRSGECSHWRKPGRYRHWH